MVLTNYDDTRGAYRVLDSWGTDWGARGYLWWQYQSLAQANPGAVAVYKSINLVYRARSVPDTNTTSSLFVRIP